LSAAERPARSRDRRHSTAILVALDGAILPLPWRAS
jgi:hypothetical protein